MTNNDLDLKNIGITQSTRIKRNLPVESLIEDIVLNKEGKIGLNGAVMVDTGQFTGRSPLDKYIVDELIDANNKIDKKLISDVIEGKSDPNILDVSEGTLILFYGRNYLHRVTQVKSKKNRILVTLNYNTQKGIKLSENARMTFFGRLN